MHWSFPWRIRTLILPALSLQNFLWWLFHEVLKGSKCAERILRVKRIQKHLQRNGQFQSWTKLIGINGLPREAKGVQEKLSNVPSGVSIYWCFCSYCRVWISLNWCFCSCCRNCWLRLSACSSPSEEGLLGESLAGHGTHWYVPCFLSHCDLQSLF